MAKLYRWHQAVSKVTMPDKSVVYIPFKTVLPEPGARLEAVIAEMLLDGMNEDELKKAMFGHSDLHFRAKTANKVRAQITAGKDGKISTKAAMTILVEQAAKGNDEAHKVLPQGEDAIKAFALRFVDKGVDVSNTMPEDEAKLVDTAWKDAKRRALGNEAAEDTDE